MRHGPPRSPPAVAPWDSNPVLERLEANRILPHGRALPDDPPARATSSGPEDSASSCGRMLGSRAFGVAEQLSRLHGRGRPAFTREQVRRALGDEG